MPFSGLQHRSSHNRNIVEVDGAADTVDSKLGWHFKHLVLERMQQCSSCMASSEVQLLRKSSTTKTDLVELLWSFIFWHSLVDMQAGKQHGIWQENHQV